MQLKHCTQKHNIFYDIRKKRLKIKNTFDLHFEVVIVVNSEKK